MNWTRLCAVVLLALSVAACSKPKQTKPEAPPATTGTTQGSGTTTAGIGDGTGAGTGATAMTAQQQALAALQQKSVIYFDFDSSEIRPEFVEVVAAHAAYLVKYPAARVRLEGHTDERGSREYNIGLGERRSQAVRQALTLQGVAEAQLTTVSYGEERPAVPGSDEAAYAQNRRVELAYQ